jgi:hypothetical protein
VGTGLAAREYECPKVQKWMLDSGASHHMVGRAKVKPKNVYKSPVVLSVATCNGNLRAGDATEVFIPAFDSSLQAMVMEKCPDILSVGRLCNDFGVSMNWPAWARHPEFRDSEGKEISCWCENYVPFISATSLPDAVACAIWHKISAKSESPPPTPPPEELLPPVQCQQQQLPQQQQEYIDFSTTEKYEQLDNEDDTQQSYEQWQHNYHDDEQVRMLCRSPPSWRAAAPPGASELINRPVTSPPVD